MKRLTLGVVLLMILMLTFGYYRSEAENKDEISIVETYPVVFSDVGMFEDTLQKI